MNVPSYQFLGFAIAAALLTNVSSNVSWRRVVLLLANLAFFATFVRVPLAAVPFAGLLVFGYLCVGLAKRYKSRQIFIAMTLAALGMFCWLKQYSFVPHGALLSFSYVTVGMSYVFFRIMHLIIDAYQDALPDAVDLLSYVNYALNFACLVSGPIQMYGEYRTQEKDPARLDAARVASAIERVVLGFFKAALVSPALLYLQHRAQQDVMVGSDAQRVLYFTALMAIFPVYLYINFSGYMDVVVGTAKLLRMDLPENFNRPFVARSFIELWSRWHITLSNWLKTYVYSPFLLTLIRRFPSTRIEPWLGVLAYFVTFFLIGAWHGQTTMFLFFGVLQGLGVSVNKIFQILMVRRFGRAGYRKMCDNLGSEVISRGLTFSWFAVTMLWFWSTWAQLGGIAAHVGVSNIAVSMGVLVVISGALWTGFARLEQNATAISGVLQSPYYRTAWCTALAVATVSITVALQTGAPHIVYKGF